MSRSRRRRGRIIAAVLSACLVVSVSAVMTCGNADWSAPPRFDGAGYAVLARAWLSGQGYRAIDHPDRPRHAHFPPGYPLVLAVAWQVTGKSATAAHVLSTLFTLGACLAAWSWFRRLMASPAALVLGLALAVNWLWARTGSAILSEPLYMLLSQLTILAFMRQAGATRWEPAPSVVLSAVLAACLLTRHVAIGLALAVLLDLTLRRRWREAMAIAALSAILVSPWLGWMAVVGSGGGTQASLLVQGDLTLAQRIARQLVFYVQRIPDQLTGPFVEVGTLYQHSAIIASIANLWAVLATAVIVAGWASHMRTAATTAGRARPALHARDSGRLAVHRGRAVSDPSDSEHPGRRGRGPGGTGWHLRKTNGVVADHGNPGSGCGRPVWSWPPRCRIPPTCSVRAGPAR